jgi:uncharacterized protein YjbJ (UPF0337 family)
VKAGYDAYMTTNRITKDGLRLLFNKMYKMCEYYNFSKELYNKYYQGEPHLYKVKIHSLLKFEEMNPTELKGNLNEQKAKLKQKFAVLTDNDGMLIEGKKEEKFGRFQINLGRTQEYLQKIVSEI